MSYTPHKVDIHVGARLRAKRKSLNMSQSVLGQSLDMTFQQIQKYEKGTNRISASVLYQITKILDVDITYFFDGLEGAGDNPSLSSQDIVLRIDDPRVRKAFIALAQNLQPKKPS